MDMNIAFLNWFIYEEVYVAPPEGCIDPVHFDHVYRLWKALYGINQAFHAWYEHLSNCLSQQGYFRCGVDKTMFIKWKGSDFLIAQIYVHDIFGGSSSTFVICLVDQMKAEYQMSIVGDLAYSFWDFKYDNALRRFFFLKKGMLRM